MRGRVDITTASFTCLTGFPPNAHLLDSRFVQVPLAQYPFPPALHAVNTS